VLGLAPLELARRLAARPVLVRDAGLGVLGLGQTARFGHQQPRLVLLTKARATGSNSSSWSTSGSAYRPGPTRRWSYTGTGSHSASSTLAAS
jgi:hypothetical protein